MEEAVVVLDDSTNNDVEEFSCDICKVSYTTDGELRDHIWSLMHHIKMEQRKKGSVHNCNLCFTSCPNIIEYGKHLNQEKHKRAIEESRRQKGEEELLIGKNILFAKLKQKEAANKVDSSQQLAQPSVSSTVDMDVNLSDPETSSRKKNNLGRKRNQFNKRGKGHQRSYSQPISIDRGKFTNDGGGPKSRDDLPRQRQNSNQKNRRKRNNNYHGQFSERENNDNFREKNYYNDRYDMPGEQNSGHGIPDQQNGSYENPHWHMSSMMAEEQPVRWEESMGYHGNYDEQGRLGAYFGQQRQECEFWQDDLLEPGNRWQDNGPFHWRDDRYRNNEEYNYNDYGREYENNQRNMYRYMNPDSEDSSGQKRRRSHEKNSSRKERRYDSSSHSYENGYGHASVNPHEQNIRYHQSDNRKDQEQISGNPEWGPQYSGRRRSVRFSDEVPLDNSRCVDEADSTTDLEGRERTKNSSASSSSKNSDDKNKADRKKNGGGIMKRKKKSGKVSPTGTPREKVSPNSGKKSKSVTESGDKGSSVLERAEKLCRELREKREAAKTERENKEKQQKLEKQEELNQQLKSLSEKNKEYVKGHVSAEEKRASENLTDDTGSEKSAVVKDLPTRDRPPGKSAKQSNTKGSQSDANKNIEKIRQNIEKSVKCLTQKPPQISQAERENKPEQVNRNAETKSREEMSLEKHDSDSGFSNSSKEKHKMESRTERRSSTHSDVGMKIQPSSHSGRDKEGQPSNKPDRGLDRQLSNHSDRERQPSVSSDRGLDKQLSNQSDQSVESTSSQKAAKKKKSENLPTESLLKMVNSPRSRKERLKLAEILKSHASSRTRLSLPRYNLQMSGSYDELQEVDVANLGLEMLSPDVQLQIAHLIEADVKPDLNELERTLFSSSSQNAEASVQSPPVTDNMSPTENRIMTSAAVDNRMYKDDVSVKAGKHGRSRSVSIDSEKSQKGTSHGSHSQMETDPSPELRLSDLSPVVVKQEKIDSGYEKSSLSNSSLDMPVTQPDLTSGKRLDDSSSTIVSSRVFSDMDVDHLHTVDSHRKEHVNAPSRMHMDNFAGKDSDNDAARLQSSTASSVPSSFASSAASLFHTVYDISVKEEAIRSELKHVDEQISYLQKVIEEASVHLNRCTEKKRKFQEEEEDLRRRRLKVLKDAQNTHLSGQPTPGSSEVEFLSDYTASQPMRSKVAAHTSSTNVDSFSSLLSNCSPQVEPERDHHSVHTKSSDRTTNYPTTNTLTSTTSPDPILQQLQDLSSSLQKDSQQLEQTGFHGDKRSGSSNSYLLGQQEHLNASRPSSHRLEEKESVSSTTDFVPASGKTGRLGGERRASSSDTKIPLIDGEQDRSVTKCLPPPLEPSRDSKTKVTKPGGQQNNKTPDSVVVIDKKPPVQAKASDQKEAKKQPHLPSGAKGSVELKDVGFVTLNSLMENAGVTSPKGSAVGHSQSSSMGNHREQLSSPQAIVSKQMADQDSDPAGGPVQKPGASTVNVQYMGSLPADFNYSNLFKPNSYMVLDGKSSSEVYKQIQALIGKSDPQRSSDGKVSKGANQKLGDVNISDSNYESVNSNCSLGEKIRQYAKTNGSPKALHSKRRKENRGGVVMNSDSDSDRSDRTLQDDPTLLSDSATPVRVVKESAIVHQKLNLDNSNQVEGAPAQTTGCNDDILSGLRKKLKTKKERDRMSARKQKEDFIIDSSSEGTSHEGDHIPKVSSMKPQLYKSVNNIPAAVEAEGMDPEEAALVETGSDDSPEPSASHPDPYMVTDRAKRLLEEVQLDSMTESEDNRSRLHPTPQASESKFKLTADAVESFRTAIKKSIQQKPIGKDSTPVIFSGPSEVVTGLQVSNQSLYVSYQSRIIQRFNLKTSLLENQYDSKVYPLSCLHVCRIGDTERLYGGGTSQRLVSFDCSSGKVLNIEHLEGKIQCLHEAWGKLYVGTDCGTVVVKSLQYDKILDTFMCADRPVSCLTSGSEGMRKLLIVGAYDSIVFVYDASTGLLIRMLEGHTKTSFSLQVDGDVIYSGSGDKTVMEHNLATGELLWTFSHAVGIVTAVCVYGKYLLCASYDKYIRCYGKKSRKLLKLYYGAGMGLITKMIVVNDMLITGNRKGVVEAVPLDTHETSTCQFEGCNFIFGLREHLLKHIVYDHVTAAVKKFQCRWKECQGSFSTENGKQEAEAHMREHVFVEEEQT